MELTEQQAEQIKEQLLTNLDKFPEDKKSQIKKQIMSMSIQEIEDFIKQNQLSHLEHQCIFCSIIDEKLPSYKIDENPENIAILELNPLTKGHTLVVPKQHLEKLPSSTNEFAKLVAEKIKQKLNPLNLKLQETKIMNHPLIEIIPVYENEVPKQRKKAAEEDLIKLQEELTAFSEEKQESTKDSAKGERFALDKSKDNKSESGVGLDNSSDEKLGGHVEKKGKPKEIPKLPPRIP